MPSYKRAWQRRDKDEVARRKFFKLYGPKSNLEEVTPVSRQTLISRGERGRRVTTHLSPIPGKLSVRLSSKHAGIIVAKIVLCGTPLSGKSELAIELERAMRKHGLHPTAIIDNYTKEIQGRLDLGVGPEGSYLVDLAVAIERLGQEFYEGRNGAEHFIVCGSLVETAIHTAINCQVNQSDVSWAVANVVMPLYPLMRRSSGIHTTYLLPPPEEPSKFELAMWRITP